MFANLPLSIRVYLILVFTFCLPSLSLATYAQATQTLGSLEVDRFGRQVENQHNFYSDPNYLVLVSGILYY